MNKEGKREMTNDMKKLKEQVVLLSTRIESMEKEMYEIRKGNTRGDI